jgi:hypothetical protein
MANLLGQNIGTNYKGILNLNTLNGNLTTTLEAITDGDGNASPLNLGTTSIRFGGATGLFWDNANNFLGLGTSSPSRTLTVSGNGARIRDLNVGVTTQTSIGNTNNIIANWATLGVGIANGTALTASAMLHVRGDGTNPIARFEDSAGTSSISINSAGNQITGTGTLGSATLSWVNSDRILFTSGIGGASATSFLFQNSSNFTATNGVPTLVQLSSTFSSASVGTSTPRVLNIEYTANYTNTQSGTLTGIRLNATETALNGMGHNLMDLQVGGATRFRVNNVGNIIALNFAISRDGSTGADGNIVLSNTAGTSFGILKLGGTTNSFPAIKRNAAQIDFRLADDSAFCNVNLGTTNINGNLLLGDLLQPTGSTDMRLIIPTANRGLLINQDYSFTSAPSALVEVRSTTKGFLPPRMTTTQKNAITTPATGLVLYDSTLNKLCVYTGSAWETITSV